MSIFLLTSDTKTTVFYMLLGLNIAFLVFVFISRYLTRHDEHDHDDDDDDDDDHFYVDDTMSSV